MVIPLLEGAVAAVSHQSIKSSIHRRGCSTLKIGRVQNITAENFYLDSLDLGVRYLGSLSSLIPLLTVIGTSDPFLPD
jgi:hypothetical protein